MPGCEDIFVLCGLWFFLTASLVAVVLSPGSVMGGTEYELAMNVRVEGTIICLPHLAENVLIENLPIDIKRPCVIVDCLNLFFSERFAQTPGGIRAIRSNSCLTRDRFS